MTFHYINDKLNSSSYCICQNDEMYPYSSVYLALPNISSFSLLMYIPASKTKPRISLIVDDKMHF